MGIFFFGKQQGCLRKIYHLFRAVDELL